MKRMLWFWRDEKPAIEIVMSVETADWLLEHMPKDDKYTDDLRSALVDAHRASFQPNAVKE